MLMKTSDVYQTSFKYNFLENNKASGGQSLETLYVCATIASGGWIESRCHE
jgi:hypothetical protein